MIYVLNIFVCLLIGYFFHILIHKIPWLRKLHYEGHHEVYKKKIKTKEYISNEKNCFKVFGILLDVEYLILIPVFVYCFFLYLLDVNFLYIIPTMIFLLYFVDYFHKAFHTASHPLNKYKIFREAAHRHVLHHVHDEIWYGVGLGDWADVLFKTDKKS